MFPSVFHGRRLSAADCLQMRTDKLAESRLTVQHLFKRDSDARRQPPGSGFVRRHMPGYSAFGSDNVARIGARKLELNTNPRAYRQEIRGLDEHSGL